ncbi:MAG: hypothetical protein ACR2LY_07765 [Thermoleophilaceae bacterium]
MHGKDGHLSFQTLVIASLSSAAAALLTSFFWESGTVFSAAFTPVIVSIVGEALKRPAKTISEVRPVRRDRATSTARGTPAMSGVPSPAAGTAPSGDTAPSVTSSTAGGVAGRPRGFTRLFGRRVNMRLALATGGLAFLIAAAFLTLPELVAGESVAGQPGRTTLGGGSSVDTSGESTAGDAKDAGAGQDGEEAAPEPKAPAGAEQQDPAVKGEAERSRQPQQQQSPGEEPPAAGEPPSPQPQPRPESSQPPSQSP